MVKFATHCYVLNVIGESMSNVESVFCEVCSLTFTEYEYEIAECCPYCGNQAAETLLGLVDDEIEVMRCDEC